MNPNLIETSTKNFLFNNLQHCHNYRINMYYYALNIGLFLMFIIIVYFVLYRCSKNKISDYEKQQRMIRDQELVLSKIRYFKEQNKANQENCYTNTMDLPFHY
tara:strand:- start:10352 stop:10660 length:309 start_codon:yes stop_codon:yes gene_type:complete